jgi:hypothetical protein
MPGRVPWTSRAGWVGGTLVVSVTDDGVGGAALDHGTERAGVTGDGVAPSSQDWNPPTLPAARRGDEPSRNRCTTPQTVAAAVLCCCTRCSTRSNLAVTSGAKRARTADLLNAIWRQHVHPRPSVQVTVLTRPRKSARVRVSCCTSVLYRCQPPPWHQS